MAATRLPRSASPGCPGSSPNQTSPNDGGPDDFPADETEEPAPAVLIYTSGTTSAPKGVLVWTEIPRAETGKVVRRQAMQKLVSPAG